MRQDPPVTSSSGNTAVAYTDGACSGNPGPGGWAWAIPGGRYATLVAGEAEEAVLFGVEDVLLSAAHAGRGGVRLLERPAGGDGIEGPRLGVLFATAPLIVARPTN